ncbi:hypothetical protein CLU79DRAFT_728373 [Phycomyces nitens]|nr:hypothetical protein CLU79DRAFT_728373 [Phycomyces nitens]
MSVTFSDPQWPVADLTSPETPTDGLDQAGESTPSVRKRTRATADQLAVLEDTFAVNVSPNSKLRKQLAEQLQMSERSIQIWFQNRRAKVKHIQKRAQMKMHHASIRAQLYHQHQHHHQPALMPLQPQYYSYYPSRMPISRAHSVDAIGLNRQPSPVAHFPYSTPTPSISSQNTTYTPSPPLQQLSQSTVWPQTNYDSSMYRQSMPPQQFIDQFNYEKSSEYPTPLVDFPEFLHGQLSPSASPNTSMPTLVAVPDAGPTAMLAVLQQPYTPSLSLSPDLSFGVDLWPLSTDSLPSSQSISDDGLLSAESLSTIDPSNLIMPSPTSQASSPPGQVHLSAVTLTIGTWHRMKLNATDLMCVYTPETRMFAWHISDNDCHFKMEVPLHAISSIDYVACDVLADVHIDISEPPLFYMESSSGPQDQDARKPKKKPDCTDENPVWVQCSDFTEGKQASRLFRHTLKGVSHPIQQELLELTSQHKETQRLVHFLDMPSQLRSLSSRQSAGMISPADVMMLQIPDADPSALYWSSGMMAPPPPAPLLRDLLY